MFDYVVLPRNCVPSCVLHGEILLSIPKASGRPTENSSSGVEKLKTKAEVTEEMGYSKDQFNNVKKDL